MKQKLMWDLSNMTSIKPSVLDKLVNITEFCICDYLIDAKLSDNDIVEVDIGIGKLLLGISQNSVEYKFIPSGGFEKLVVDSLLTMKSPIMTKLEDGIESKLMSSYKELF